MPAPRWSAPPCWLRPSCCCSPSICCSAGRGPATADAEGQLMLASAGLYPTRAVTADRLGLRAVLIATALAFLCLFLLLPLLAVFVEALRQGFVSYLAGITEPDALAAIQLTLLVAAIAVPLNLVFGIAAAWA